MQNKVFSLLSTLIAFEIRLEKSVLCFFFLFFFWIAVLGSLQRDEFINIPIIINKYLFIYN